jgi:hypothetical protein
MAFITGIDIDAIHDPAEMARALRCAVLDTFDPGETRIAPVGHYDANSLRHHEFGEEDRDFLVSDRAGNSCWRVLVCNDEGGSDDVEMVRVLDLLREFPRRPAVQAAIDALEALYPYDEQGNKIVPVPGSKAAKEADEARATEAGQRIINRINRGSIRTVPDMVRALELVINDVFSEVAFIESSDSGEGDGRGSIDVLIEGGEAGFTISVIDRAAPKAPRAGRAAKKAKATGNKAK